MLRFQNLVNNIGGNGQTSDNFYINQHKTFVERIEESMRIKEKYPDRVPVICEKTPGSGLEILDKRKYLVPNDLTTTQFLFVIRKRLRLAPEKAIFLFVNKMIPPSSYTMFQLYNEHRDKDGFLYLNYTEENVFG